MNARNFFAELKGRNVSESRAHELARRTKQRAPDRVGVGGYRCPQRDVISLGETTLVMTKAFGGRVPSSFISAIDWEAIGSPLPALSLSRPRSSA